MAIPSWLTVSPTSGSGNGTIGNSAGTHTGRVARSGSVTVTATGLATPKTYTVTQSAKAEFVSFDNGSEMAAPKAGGTVTVAGKSNSPRLTYQWVDEDQDIELPLRYTAAGSTTNNAGSVYGDPGATAQYPFSISIDVPENTTTEEIDRTLSITTYNSQTAQIVIKQAAGDPTLSISPTSITLAAIGQSAQVTVTSNTSWTVS